MGSVTLSDAQPSARTTPVALALTTALLASCGTGPTAGPGAIELANIRPWNIVPKSSPRQLITAFRRYCLADTQTQARAALRSSDYVKTRNRGGGIETYVVDDRKPAVMLTRNAGGSGCAVVAAARTGQNNRFADFVVAEFPKVVPVDPRRISARTENAWLAAGPSGGILYVQRQGPRHAPTQVIFGIWRPN